MSSAIKMLTSIKDHQLFLPALITFLILVITSILFAVFRKLHGKGDTVLFVGLAGSGKTTILTRLISNGNQWITYMSLKENKFFNYVNSDGISLKLVDYPGSEAFKKALFQKWFAQDKGLLKCIVFAVDSASFNKKDVAEFLYDVLYELNGKLPILVIYNKQDIGHAKSGQLLTKSLEQEFGLINVSREAALSSTTGQSDKRVLSNTGKEFNWSDLKGYKPKFVECSAHGNNDYSLEPLQKWLDEI